MSKSDHTPKKIAGLKLPKEIREAPAIKALLATAAGRKLLGDALIEGAAAAAAKVIAAQKAAKKPDLAKTLRAKKPAAPKAEAVAPKPVPAPLPVVKREKKAKPVLTPAAPVKTAEDSKPTAPAAPRPAPVAPPAIATAPVEPPNPAPESIEPEAPAPAKPQIEVLDATNANDDEPVPGKNSAAE